MDFYTLHFDGSCPKNPGNKAAYGYSVHHYVNLMKEGNGGMMAEYLDNNIAEFYALYKGLEYLRDMLTKPALIEIRGDSALVIKIMNKKWKAQKDRPFYEIYRKVDHLIKELRNRGCNVLFTWIPRRHNQLCDKLSKFR
jgi:ribonuclease HI